jgi:signal recognition particle subunit SRP54
MLKKMGSMKSVMGLIPGIGKQLQGLEINERDMSRVEAIVLSMTPQERRVPHLIDLSRRRRIAAGSGTTLEQVNQLMSARKQMQKLMKGVSKGKMPTLPGLGVNGPPGIAPDAARVGRSSPRKKKRKTKRR